jgi:hypothetical protein
MSDRKLSIEIREVEQLEKVLKTLDGIAHMIQGGEAEPRSNILLASLATLSFHHPTREIIVGVEGDGSLDLWVTLKGEVSSLYGGLHFNLRLKSEDEIAADFKLRREEGKTPAEILKEYRKNFYYTINT